MSLLRRVPWPIGIAVLAAVALLVFAACGDDEEEGGTPSPVETATPTATLTPEATPAPPAATLAPQAERPASAQEVQAEVVTPMDSVIEVSTLDNLFSKNHFQVSPGQTVTFDVTNFGSNPHTFTIAGVDGQFGTDDDITTATLAGGEEELLEATLDIAGTYIFRCNVHPTVMWGEIDVQAGGASIGY